MDKYIKYTIFISIKIIINIVSLVKLIYYKVELKFRAFFSIISNYRVVFTS